MTFEARLDATSAVIKGTARKVDWPKVGNRNAYPSEIFGQNVCGLKVLAKNLPKSVYALFVAQLAVIY